jgi:hypothetical protein
MRLNEHRKKGCEKTVDDDGNQLTFKLYLPLKNTIEGVILAKSGNVLEYKAKLKASSKPRCSHFVVTKTISLAQ